VPALADANVLAVKVRAIQNLAKTRQELVKVQNPAASKIWDVNGNFDQQVFDELFDKHKVVVTLQSSAQTDAITRKGFNDFLKSKETAESKTHACTVFGVIKLSWQRITSGSLDELFDLLANCTTDDGIPAITKYALYLFYTEPDKVLRACRPCSKDKS
jgi:hypothetical protein